MKDQRRPESKYKIPVSQSQVEEQQQFDVYQFIAMLLSFQGVIFKQKIFFWLSVVAMLSSFFNKRGKIDFKQYSMITLMIVFSFVGIYITPNLQKPQVQPAN